jgi:hypothetical protein
MLRRLDLADRRSWIGFGIWLAVVATLLVLAFAQPNPFRQPARADQANWIISTFSIDRKPRIEQGDLTYLNLFFGSSILAELWDIIAREGPITDWADIKDATDKIGKSDLYRLSVFYNLTGSIED